MVQQLSKSQEAALHPIAVDYPDSDGQPMSDNTEQFKWIVTIKENLELIYAQAPDVFVAGDLLWYPVEGNNKIRQAPDAMVAFGRPKGYRGSYMQWKENNVSPQVVFEILSPGNRRAEMARKLLFYERYGVEEYYEYDPDNVELIGLKREGSGLEAIETIDGWTSPRLNIRFEITPETLVLYRPDGSPFLTYVELGQRLDETSQRLDETSQRLDETSQRLDETSQQLSQSQAENDKLVERLKALGVDPSEL